MAGRPLEHLLRHLRRIAAPAGGGVSDADLLGRFADGRDEAAFETLVWRHGLLVYGVCNRVLGHTQDAEDAFQATFLILARKAGAVRRRGAVGPWLYRVAQRVALRVRGKSKTVVALPVDVPAAVVPDAAERGDLRRVLDEEIGKLPARYRAAVVLRYLEGRSTTEAAAALGCPPGTVLSRLAWARRRLRSRLTARGAALSAALASIEINDAAGAVPARWVSAAVAAAGAFAAGGRSGRPALLAAEVLRTMLIARLRIGAVVMFGALAAGAGLMMPGLSPGRVDPQAKPAAQPPVEVAVARPTRRITGEFAEYGGRAVAAATVEIRSRITSEIVRVSFHPGAKVKQGDVLFELDPRAIGAEFKRAQAELQRAEVHLQQAQTELQQVRVNAKAAAASQVELTRSQGAADDAKAGLLIAKAGLDRARLDLDATHIDSPINGRTGGNVLSAGNLATPTTTLVTIVAADPMHVAFDVDERSLFRLRKLIEHGEVTAEMKFAGEDGFPRRGKVEFVDNRVDPKTDTVQVRASLPNPKGDILPGMFAHIRLPLAEPHEELLVPQSALTALGDQGFVLIAGQNDAIEYRPVSFVAQVGGMYLITAGLNRDDRVVTNGMTALKPGAPIRFKDSPAPK